jgi:hypothetical protein
MDVVSTAKVTIAATAHIYAGGSVSISASSTQTQPLIPIVGTGFNLVNVKVGSATVEILGAIEAGGNVDASAKRSSSRKFQYVAGKFLFRSRSRGGCQLRCSQ